jgi:hypothetical protein
MGLFKERVQYKTRYFIPTDEGAAEVYGKLTAQWPVAEVIQMREEGGTPPPAKPSGFRPGFAGAGAPKGMHGAFVPLPAPGAG